ncbi:MAG: polysaccharide pyruvyl transferase family protein, partial [Atopobium sp.]|nr:polysaccharide pyruvyl transferase family protein [Atopobium sp.]
MFPKIFSYAIKKRIDCDIDLYSMHECEKPYNDNTHVYSFSQFETNNSKEKYDALVIGGGEFLHFKPIEFLENEIIMHYPVGYIWEKPLEMAISHNIPSFINCVGAPFDFTVNQSVQLRNILNYCKIIALRDEFSEKRIIAAGIDPVKVCLAADNLCLFNQVYSLSELTNHKSELEKKCNSNFTIPYIVIQYGTSYRIEEIVKQIKIIKQGYQGNIYLLPVNYCHDDKSFADSIISNFSEGVYEIKEYLQPIDMMSIIAGAECFLGTSLHGNLTAINYGVKTIGIDMYPSFVSKMDGIFSMFGIERYLVPTPEGIAAAFYEIESDESVVSTTSKKLIEIQEILNRYFDDLSRFIKEG